MEVYRAANISAVDLADGTVLVTPDRGRTQRIAAIGLHMLQLCKDFRSIEGHAAVVLSRLSIKELKPPLVYEMLWDFARRGLFIERQAIAATLTKAVLPPRNLPALGIVTITTDSRPSEFGNCLGGYLNADNEPSPDAVIVCDDSRRERDRLAIIEIARSASRDSRVPIHYIGRDERETYATALAGLGIPLEVARFAFLGHESTRSVGANRNGAIVETLGQRILMVDDDTLPKVAQHPEAQRNAVDCGHEDPTDFWFYRTRRDAVDAACWKQLSVLEEHGALLGRYLAEFAAGPRFIDSCNHVLSSTLNQTGKVRLTVSGAVGDSGLFSSVSLLTGRLSRPSRDRMTSSEDLYRVAMCSREVVRVPPRTAITHGQGCVAMTIGLDNQDLLPPFLPVYRNQDGVFGAFLSLCMPAAFTGHPPLAILHNSEQGRRYQRVVTEPQTVRVSELIIILAGKCELIGEPASRLRRLGCFLRDLGTLSLIEYDDFVTRAIYEARCRTIRNLQAYLSHAEAPPYLRQDLKTVIANTVSTLTEPHCSIPAELRAATDEIGLKLTQRLIVQVGELLIWWPDVISAARYLKEHDRSLSVVIA
jgi:hypothetical protein